PAGGPPEQVVHRDVAPEGLERAQLVVEVRREVGASAGGSRKSSHDPPAEQPRFSKQYRTGAIAQSQDQACAMACASSFVASWISLSDTVSGGARRSTRSPIAFTSSPSS